MKNLTWELYDIISSYLLLALGSEINALKTISQFKQLWIFIKQDNE